MKELLQELAQSNLVRITGSFADGTQTEESDIDFKVREDRPDLPRGQKRNIEKIMEIVERHGVKWRSTETGYIFTHRTSGNGYLPRQLEFSDRFEHRPNRLKEVEIEQVKFKTY